MSSIKENLISNGVKNLKEFGYPNVTMENIFTDSIYSKMFKRMLENNKGEDKQIDIYIDEILREYF